ncbi:hypothetical protein [Streptomyces sp. NPDC088358]|uniref:hypothetical protein n=1 Tax=Streptomyces sp. NPDC088358 TaxID=3365857 RepID=UPI003802551F
MISTDCVRDMLEAIELGRPSTPTDRVSFQGVDVFGPPARFIAQDRPLSFWRPFAADDEPEEEQGYYFSSVLVAQPGYYDTPAQAAERLQQVPGR